MTHSGVGCLFEIEQVDEARHLEYILYVLVDVLQRYFSSLALGVLEYAEQYAQAARSDVIQLRTIENDVSAVVVKERLQSFLYIGRSRCVEFAFEAGYYEPFQFIDGYFHIVCRLMVKCFLSVSMLCPSMRS